MMHCLKAFGCTILWTIVIAAFLSLPARGQVAEEIPLGSSMPMSGEVLTNVQGGQASLSSLVGDRGTVVAFWSNQCPWVERYERRVLDLANTFSQRGISFVLVNSNDADAYPQESAQAGAERFRERGYSESVTYLVDPSSAVARAFGAERTPHVFVFDANNALAYVGTIDDSPGDPQNVSQYFLQDALEALASGADVEVAETKAFGCTVKLKN